MEVRWDTKSSCDINCAIVTSISGDTHCQLGDLHGSLISK